MSALPTNPYGSPPIYLPFSEVASPLTQSPSLFSVNAGMYWRNWYPFAPVTCPGWNEGLHPVCPITATPYGELIDYAMPMGVQDMIIPFAVEKVSPGLLLSGPMISNFVDVNPLCGLAFTVLNISTSLLVIQLNALMESPNYVFSALVSGVK